MVGFCFRVKDGGFVVMPICSVEVPVFEFLDLGEGVAILIGQVGAHELINAGEIGETALTFERFKEVAHRDSRPIIFTVSLQ